MERWGLMVAVMAGLLFAPRGARSGADDPKPLALVGVAVIDVEAGKVVGDQTVFLRDGKIDSVGPTDAISVPVEATTVAAEGKYLIPGLWDMHVHLVGTNALTLSIVHGVTGVREMHALFPAGLVQLRKSVAEGKTVGPKIVAALAMIDGGKQAVQGAYLANTPEEGRAAVRDLKRRGADFVKIYSKLPADTYRAIVHEAKAAGLDVTGHVPESISMREASDLGQKCMEHLLGFMTGCSKDEEALRAEMTQAMASADRSAYLPLLFRSQSKALDGFDPAKAKALCAHLAKNGTWQVPTLAMLRNVSRLTNPEVTNDPRQKYMPGFVVANWKPSSPLVAFLIDNADEQKRQFARALEVVRMMHAAGVKFLAGTDTPNPYCYPGSSLHEELRLLTEAGLSPAAALRAATSDAAHYLGRSEIDGSIAPGKLADLVLLDADPLADIGNVSRIRAVVRAGRLLDRAELDDMLAALAPAASKEAGGQ